MGTQQWTPLDEGSRKNPILARLIFGTRLNPTDQADTGPQKRQPSYGWHTYEKFRTTRTAWYLRRYTNLYTHLSTLDDKTIAAILGVGWALWLLGSIIGPQMLGPGGIVLGVLLALAWAAATWLIAGWWLDYRRSGHQLKHQLLARDTVIASGRELEDEVSAAACVAKADTVRPAFTADVQAHGRSIAVAHRVLGEHTGQRVRRVAVAYQESEQ